ncbi:MAG: MFS transporter [Gammaproteobacteria bacterium]|nr:MFS transporter [Gammaproteobacteria bacterium]
MSTVVAVVKNNKACIAGDSLTSFGDTKLSARHIKDSDKILNFKENYLGVVGSAAHQLVLESLFQTQPELFDFTNRLSTFETLRKLHPILKDQYFLNSKEEDDDAYESTRLDALMMNENGIFGIYALREVDQYESYWAVGSGSEFALGAMFSVYDALDSAEDIAKIGVRAGAEFDNASSLPMTSYTIDLKS